MKILDFLHEEDIIVELHSAGKKDSITELIDRLISSDRIKKKDKSKIIKALMDREELGSTGIGQGIAIPHAKSNSVKDIICAFGNSKKGIAFDALDGEPVYIIFLLLAEQDSSGVHLKALAKISRLLKDKFFRQGLKQSESPEEVVNTIKKEDIY